MWQLERHAKNRVVHENVEPDVVAATLASVLPDDQIKPSIVVEITQCHATALTVDRQAAFAWPHGDEVSAPIAAQPETTSGVLATFRSRDAEKILRQEQVFVAITIEVAHGQAEDRRKLSFHRQRSRFEVVATIEKNHRIKCYGGHLAHGRQPGGQHIGNARRAEGLEA